MTYLFPGTVGVLDRHGNVRKVVATGTRIIMPEIEGVGKVRIRYPIMPLHSDVCRTFVELIIIGVSVCQPPLRFTLLNFLSVNRFLEKIFLFICQTRLPFETRNFLSEHK